jgi:hypothetical protein
MLQTTELRQDKVPIRMYLGNQKRLFCHKKVLFWLKGICKAE